MWYCLKGSPHWDNELWILMGHLYVGGMWMKKQSVIAADAGNATTIAQMKDHAPNNTDYRTQTLSTNVINTDITQGKPSNLNDYFYLPALGGYYSDEGGKLDYVAVHGIYWTSTPNAESVPSSHITRTYILAINSGFVAVAKSDRFAGFHLFKSSSEDGYRPF